VLSCFVAPPLGPLNPLPAGLAPWPLSEREEVSFLVSARYLWASGAFCRVCPLCFIVCGPSPLLLGLVT